MKTATPTPLEPGEQVTIGPGGTVIWTVERYVNRRGDLRLVNPLGTTIPSKSRTVQVERLCTLRRVSGNPPVCPKPRD